LAFAGPSFQKTVSPEGYCTLSPADYIPYFQKHDVGLVVRLNKKNYEEQDFIDAGIDHLDQFYLDGSCPPMDILQRVLRGFEAVPKHKAFAVHCKAGLGRTGTCIGAYLMKHHRMTAPEVIAWMRICRPGMVIGPQQQFLQDLEPVMWQEGEIMRSNLTNQVSSKMTALTTGVANNGKKKKKPSTPDSPKSVKESVEGRPGQAAGLLAARRHRHVPVPMSVSTPTKDKSKSKPAPVTPDTASTKSRSTASSSSRMRS
jgi:protein-tyrosine phosphatase